MTDEVDDKNTIVHNINIGILGHVDSGKTSLAKALSRVASTAAFDKNPQSQERGITLDLGFSAFYVEVPPTVENNPEQQQINTFVRESFKIPSNNNNNNNAPPHHLTLQFTLVDCPGHASLIKAVMGAAHIIDLMILVIDITKGIQTQTAECIVLGEMLGRKLVVVLNKIDLIPGETPEDKRQVIEKKKKQLRAVFSKTRWPNAPFVEVSANPATGAGAGAGAASAKPPIGMDNLKNALALCSARMARSGSLMSLNKQKLEPSQFFMMVDHCFGVKGHGTVLTGTVVGGSVSIGDEVKIPDLGLSRRVKSIQVFRKPVQTSHCGDRIGLCVTQVNAERLERGIACSASPNSPILTIHHACVCSISKVRFFKGEIESSHMIFHVTIGHVTAMATMKFFSLNKKDSKHFSQQQQQSAGGESNATTATATAAASSSTTTSKKKANENNNNNNNQSLFDFEQEYEYEERLNETAVKQFADHLLSSDNSNNNNNSANDSINPEDAIGFVESDRDYFAVLLLDRPVTTVLGAMVIASHLDHSSMEIGGNNNNKNSSAANASSSSSGGSCRLAMYGQLLTGEIAEYLPASFGIVDKQDKEAWRVMKVVKYRERQVNIEKVLDSRSCVARPPKTEEEKEKERLEREAKRAKKMKKTSNKQKTAAAVEGGGGGEEGGAATEEQEGKTSSDAKQQQQREEEKPQEPTTTTSSAAAISKVVFHQPVVELTKFIGFPVIFRKRTKKPRSFLNKNNKNNKKKGKKGDDDDDDDNAGGSDEEDEDENNNNNNDGKTVSDQTQTNTTDSNQQQQQQQQPRFVDIRGKIESVYQQQGNRVKVVFYEDAFDGNRAFGNVLMLDKKYPFSTSFKVEADL